MEISTILDFCGGHFEFCQYKKLLNDDRVSSIGFMISGFSSTRINNKTLYVLQNPLQPAATRLVVLVNVPARSHGHMTRDVVCS